MKASRLFLIAVLIAFIGAALFVYWGDRGGKAELRMLGYVGYDEPEFLQPLEKALGAKITVDTYVGGEEMYTKFTQAPKGTYDIVVLDAEYGERLFVEKRVTSLDPKLWKYNDLFSKFQTGEPARSGDNVYAAVARWGSIGIVFNTTQIEAERINSYDIFFDPKLKGRIGVYDWYLPNMGIFSLSLGNKEPYNLTPTELTKLRERLMQLRPQVTSIQPNPGQVLADLRSETVWIAPGIGEWAAAALATEGRPIDWIVPSPGGIMWVEAFAVAADSRNDALAQRFISEVMNPQNLALLATRKAYFSQITRKSAYQNVPERAKKYLKANDLSALEAVSESLQFRHLPGPTTTEKDWIAVWTQFKSGQ